MSDMAVAKDKLLRLTQAIRACELSFEVCVLTLMGDF